MKPILLLPIPLDSPEVWRIFRHHIDRFCCTFRQHPPGDIDLDIVAICQNADPTTELFSLFHGLPVRFVRYDGQGADLGCHQWFARTCGGNPFLICCTSRMYFHRAGWGKRLVEARQNHGPALYGLSCSCESGRLHVCTRGYGLDAADLRDYPLFVKSRDQGVPFECGPGNLFEWMTGERRRPARMVYWDGVWEQPAWFTRPNIFRQGDQSNMLIWDKHSDLWALASPMEKVTLTKRCLREGKSPVRIAGLLPLKIDEEKSTLGESLADIKRVCDEVIILHDNPIPQEAVLWAHFGMGIIATEELTVSDKAPWHDWSNRLTLLARATKYNCRWAMQLDDDETLGPSLTRERVHDLCELADAGGYGQVQVRVRTVWDSKHWRKDGVFGEMRKTLFLLNPLMLKEPRFMYGPEYTLHHFPVADLPALPVEDFIWHHGMRTRALREKNVAKYEAQDPENKFSGVTYNYLLDDQGITLEPLVQLSP